MTERERERERERGKVIPTLCIMLTTDTPPLCFNTNTGRLQGFSSETDILFKNLVLFRCSTWTILSSSFFFQFMGTYQIVRKVLERVWYLWKFRHLYQQFCSQFTIYFSDSLKVRPCFESITIVMLIILLAFSIDIYPCRSVHY